MRRRGLLLAAGAASCGALGKTGQDTAARLMSLREEDLDIAAAALALAKEIYPTLDTTPYLQQVRVLVQGVKLQALDTRDPEQRIRALNSVLFRDGGFSYDRNPFARSKEEYYTIKGVLDTKKGICFTLPLLYIAVAQRAGYPVYAVHAPDHIFVRYQDLSFAYGNIEATSGGKHLSNESYVRSLAVSQKGIAAGAYLRTMTHREFLGDIFTASAFIWTVSVWPWHLEMTPASRQHCIHGERGSSDVQGGGDSVSLALRQRVDCRDARASLPRKRPGFSRQASTCGAATPQCGCSTASEVGSAHL